MEKGILEKIVSSRMHATTAMKVEIFKENVTDRQMIIHIIRKKRNSKWPKIIWEIVKKWLEYQYDQSRV